MPQVLAQLFPLLYAACFLVLLWQAFRVMGRGFSAVPRPGDPVPASGSDRTGRLTIHGVSTSIRNGWIPMASSPRTTC